MLAGDVQRFRCERAVRTDVGVVHFELEISRLVWNGPVVALVMQGDITDRVRAAAELERARNESALIALVANHTDNAAVITDADGRIEWVNNGFTRMSGYCAQEVLGEDFVCLLAGPNTKTSALERMNETVEGQSGIALEILNYDRDGHPYWVDREMRPILAPGGELQRYVVLERNVSERRIVQASLRAAKEEAVNLALQVSREKVLIQGVISALPHAVYWKDAAGRYQGCNHQFAEWVARSETAILGHTDAQLGIEGRSRLTEMERQVLATGAGQLDTTEEVVTPDGQVRHLLSSHVPLRGYDGTVTGLVGVTADITQLRSLQDQLAAAHRLKAIGQLAAGVAHEINTPSQYVSDNIRFLRDAFGELLAVAQRASALVEAAPSGNVDGLAVLAEAIAATDLAYLSDEVGAAIEQSLEGLSHVSRIVSAMKEFSHHSSQAERMDVNHALRAAVEVARSEWKYVADVAFELAVDLPEVQCFGGEIKQVFLNLIVNAAHAITETGRQARGVIRLQTAAKPEGVEIRVVDDGCGIPRENFARVFEPFFTTKPVGKGTGQGLSMAHAVVVKQHGGQIDVQSTVGVGTTMIVRLPWTPAAAQAA